MEIAKEINCFLNFIQVIYEIVIIISGKYLLILINKSMKIDNSLISINIINKQPNIYVTIWILNRWENKNVFKYKIAKEILLILFIWLFEVYSVDFYDDKNFKELY